MSPYREPPPEREPRPTHVEVKPGTWLRFDYIRMVYLDRIECTDGTSVPVTATQASSVAHQIHRRERAATPLPEPVRLTVQEHRLRTLDQIRHTLRMMRRYD